MQFIGSSGPESDSLKGPHELKQAQANIYIFSPMVKSLFLVVGIIEGLRHPPGIQRPGSQLSILKL